MKINLTKVVTATEGKPFKNEGGDMTVKKAILLAFISPAQGNRGAMSPEAALKHRKLFDKIDAASDEVDLKSDEIVLIKSVVAERLHEIVAGFIIAHMEPDPV